MIDMDAQRERVRRWRRRNPEAAKEYAVRDKRAQRSRARADVIGALDAVAVDWRDVANPWRRVPARRLRSVLLAAVEAVDRYLEVR